MSILRRHAETLAPGQSRILSTDLALSTVIYGKEKADFLQWGASGYYDPTRREAGFIGKRHGLAPYHWLVYDERTNTWNNERPLWSDAAANGHGYDHNTIDPSTGTVYFRPYNSNTVRVWNDIWSALPSMDGDFAVAGGLTWFPSVGLFYNDGSGLRIYRKGRWTRLTRTRGSSYHDFSEYNAANNVMIFGGGNASPLWKVSANLVVSAVADAPFKIGSGSRQGLCISDPSSGKLIVYKKNSNNWAEYDIATDTWGALKQSVGDGTSPQTGTPNLRVGGAVIGIPIIDYGVIMYIQRRDSTVPNAGVWLYRHS